VGTDRSRPAPAGPRTGGPRGYDAGKKVNGRKRHIIPDTNGLLFGAQVHGADIQDGDGAVGVLASIRYLFPWLRHAAPALSSRRPRRSA
jgi:hypothetical protein